jgi:NAD(P)-dependent dehydrogenase (short-subunit alcohol dehydrogenase family)
MTSKLAGKVAVVTGGSAGIGLGIAQHFAQEGARVFITGRHQSELDKAVTAIGSSAAAIRGDTTNLADLDRIYATVKTKAGHIDVLAANAGSTNSLRSERSPRSISTGHLIRTCAASYSRCRRRCRCSPKVHR